jgi:peptidoglycan-associated lipoprotein
MKARNGLNLCLIALSALVVLFSAGCSSSSKGGDGSLSESDLAAQHEARFGSGGIPVAEGEGFFRDINFDYDSSLISDKGRQDIEYNFEVMKANPEVRVVLEGHCDERGTAEYNMALGAKRARAVKDVLISMGASSAKMETISYGEEIPLDPGQDEIAFAKNRRVHFSATK